MHVIPLTVELDELAAQSLQRCATISCSMSSIGRVMYGRWYLVTRTKWYVNAYRQ